MKTATIRTYKEIFVNEKGEEINPTEGQRHHAAIFAPATIIRRRIYGEEIMVSAKNNKELNVKLLEATEGIENFEVS